MSKSFAFDNNKLINLHSDENPILNINEECYFLFWSEENYHIPLIGNGTIVNDKFISIIDKEYYIQLNSVIENNEIIDKYLYNIYFDVVSENNKSINIKFSKNLLNKYNPIFKQNGFFVRNSLKEITELKKFYIQIIKDNLQTKIDQINELI